MRISDWSSDVCSSDLTKPALFIGRGAVGPAALALHDGNEAVAPAAASVDRDLTGADFAADRRRGVPAVAAAIGKACFGAVDHFGIEADRRSEERRGGKECVSQCRSRWSP